MNAKTVAAEDALHLAGLRHSSFPQACFFYYYYYYYYCYSYYYYYCYYHYHYFLPFSLGMNGLTPTLSHDFSILQSQMQSALCLET